MSETILAGYCQCGCGHRTAIAQRTDIRHGIRKGEPNHYVFGHRPHKTPAPRWTQTTVDEEIPRGLCGCGCGQRTKIAKRTSHSKGVRKGEPTRYVEGHRSNMRGAVHPSWRGGRRVTEDGYVSVYCPHHPHANRKGHVLEHRLVVEENWGNYFLEPDEEVHHKNGVRDDNRFENLEVQPSKSAHKRLHDALRGPRWALHHERCVTCGTTEVKHHGRGLCERCYTHRRWHQDE